MPVVINNVAIYTVSELAKKLKVSTTTIRRYLKCKILKAEKISGRWFISEQSISDFFNSLV